MSCAVLGFFPLYKVNTVKGQRQLCSKIYLVVVTLGGQLGFLSLAKKRNGKKAEDLFLATINFME